jgi:hypothetical protein
MMKAFAQLIVRQSGTVAFLCLAFAFLQGMRVCEGFWQGSGLHGYVIEKGKANMGQMFSVWGSFLNMLAAIGLAILFGLISPRRNGRSMSLGRVEVLENPGRKSTLQAMRKRRK